MALNEATRVVWVKACACRSTATASQIRGRQEYNAERDSITFVATFYPQPSCDECGTPWEPQEADHAR